MIRTWIESIALLTLLLSFCWSLDDGDKGPGKKRITFSGWLRKVWLPQQNIIDEQIQEEQEPFRQPKFLRCPAGLYSLVTKYFKPHDERGGIYSEMIKDALFPGDNVIGNEGLTVVQVLKDQIYVDTAMSMNLRPWERQRLDFILQRLHEYIQKRKQRPSNGNDETDGTLNQFDFEFVIDLKDCQTYWTGKRDNLQYKAAVGEEEDERDYPALNHYSKLPILTMTKCNGRDTIPVVQWNEERDGPFDDWDRLQLRFTSQVEQSPFWSRSSKAVFRGTFRSYSSYNVEKEEKPTILNDDNWMYLGRGRLQHYGWTRPDLFDIAIKVEPFHRKIFGGNVHKLSRGATTFMTQLEQALNYKYVLYAEGWCGWADRLKNLLYYNSTIFLQQTPCREYYQDLMEPYVHFIPVDGTFSDLPDKVKWARLDNQKLAETVASNAFLLARKYLNVNSISCYMDIIFAKYSSLMRYKPRRRPLTLKWEPFSPVRRNSAGL